MTRVFGVTGAQTNRGAEFKLAGELLLSWRIIGGVAFLDATQKNGGQSRIAPAVPTTTVNLATEWDVPFIPSFTVGGRAIYVSVRSEACSGSGWDGRYSSPPGP